MPKTAVHIVSIGLTVLDDLHFPSSVAYNVLGGAGVYCKKFCICLKMPEGKGASQSLGEKKRNRTMTDTLTCSHTWSPALSAYAKLKSSWLDNTDGKRLSPFDQGGTIEVEDESLFPRGKR